MNTAFATDSLSKVEIDRLGDLRGRLLHLHKTLLDLERRDYEKRFGRVSTGELLQLVINNAKFAWLRIISALVVEIDEVLSGDEPATLKDVEDLISQARLLFTSPGNEEFKRKYQAAMQREANIVMAHSAVMQRLRQES